MAAFAPYISPGAFEGEDHVYFASVGMEAALRLRVDLLCKYLEPLQ